MFRKTRASNGRDKAGDDHGVDRWVCGGEATTRPGQRATAAARHDNKTIAPDRGWATGGGKIGCG
jgi:hypothetical protein